MSSYKAPPGKPRATTVEPEALVQEVNVQTVVRKEADI